MRPEEVDARISRALERAAESAAPEPQDKSFLERRLEDAFVRELREPGELKRTSGAKGLERVLEARKKRRLNRPYGAAAIRLGLARAGPSP